METDLVTNDGGGLFEILDAGFMHWFGAILDVLLHRSVVGVLVRAVHRDGNVEESGREEKEGRRARDQGQSVRH
jgi:hypothetical protein